MAQDHQQPTHRPAKDRLVYPDSLLSNIGAQFQTYTTNSSSSSSSSSTRHLDQNSTKPNPPSREETTAQDDCLQDIDAWIRCERPRRIGQVTPATEPPWNNLAACRRLEDTVSFSSPSPQGSHARRKSHSTQAQKGDQASGGNSRPKLV